jgi:hypothetical protein
MTAYRIPYIPTVGKEISSIPHYTIFNHFKWSYNVFPCSAGELSDDGQCWPKHVRYSYTFLY